MKKTCKSIISFLVTFLMVLSSFNVAVLKDFNVFASNNKDKSIKVKVRIEANDRTIVPEKEIEVDNFNLKPYGASDNKDNIKAIHAIIKALESEKIDCKDKNKFDAKECTYIENIDGVKERSISDKDGWMYYINNKYVNDYVGNADIKNNDSIVVFFQEDYEKNTYSWFNKSLIKVKVGENINLKLLGLKQDINTYKENTVDISDAKILVNNKEYIINGKYITTDKQGNVTLNFDKEGTYEISAVRFNKETNRRDISRPYCKVVVEKGEVKVDKTPLINSIDEGEKILKSAKIGSQIGEYPKEAKDLLEKSINEAKEVLNKQDITIDDINTSNIKLENAILKFKESINKDKNLEKYIDDLVSYYDTWQNNNFKRFDFITSMGLRRAGVSTDKLLPKATIYQFDGLHNNARNVMSIISIGKNPKDYKGKDYTKFLLNFNYEQEDTSQDIAKAIIAMDMAAVKYNKEKVVGALLSKAHDEGDGKISFGEITPAYCDDFGDCEDEQYLTGIDHAAWTLIALSNHKDIKNAQEVIKGIKKYLKSKQNKNGLIDNSAANTALVIQALIALGENPRDDYWCVENGNEKVSMIDGILKCKKDKQFKNSPQGIMTSDIANSHILAALVDLNTMSSMYRKLKYEEVSIPVKVEISGEKEVYKGAKLNLEAKAFNYNNVVIKNAAISWKSSDENIATVKNGIVQAVKEGEVEITAYITGSETIKDTVKIKVTAPPKIDYTDTLNKEINFLKNHYKEYRNYEFLASPAIVLAGEDKENIKDRLYRYTRNNTALINVKIIIQLLGAGLDPRDANIKGKNINYVDVLEKSQVKDGENKGKFIVNKYTDKNSIEAQAYSIIALDLVDGKYDKELAIKSLLDMLNDPNYKHKDLAYKHIKTEAIAVTALANHKNILGVENKINELIGFFKENQNEDGAFDMVAGSTFVNSPVATSAVVQALLANNIDPLSWQWTKNGNTILDGMLKSKFEGRNASRSGYCQGQGLGFENSEATYYALSALVQMLNKKSIFTMMKENIKNKPSVVNKKHIEIKNLTQEKEFQLGSEAKVSIEAINNTNESKNVTLIVGLYDKSGKLIRHVVEKQIIQSGKTIQLDGKINIPKEGEYKVKAFIWDSLENMKPLANAIEMKVVDKKKVVLSDEFISGETENSTNIVLKTKENLQGDYGDNKAFVIHGVKTNPVVTKVKLNKNKIILTLNKPIKKGEKITVDYNSTGISDLIYENKSHVKPIQNYPINNSLKNITVMAYVDGDNNVENFMLSDVKEMQKGLSDDPNLNVVALVDRKDGSNIYALGEKFTDTRLYELSHNKATRISGGKQFPEITKTSNYEADMGDAHTLKKFISFCKNNYEADQYVLIILDHGAGTQGFCIDETNNNSIINIGQVSNVLTKNESVDLLVFEACLMGNAEVAYEFRPGNGSFEAKAMIASSPTMLAYGLKYDRIFRRLKYGGGNNGEEDYTLGGKETIYDPSTVTMQQFGAVILEEQQDFMNRYDDQVLAYYDLSKVSNVKKNVDNLAQLLYKENKKNVINEIRGCYYRKPLIMCYINLLSESEWRYYPYFDLYDFAEKIYNNYNKEFSPEIRNAAKNVMQSVDDFIIYSYAGKKYRNWSFKEGKTGVSIFLPDGDKHWKYQTWYTPNELKNKNYYGKLSWCIDGQYKKLNEVGNWFELLDTWYGKNKYKH